MMNIILVTQGGMYVFQLIDWYSAAIAVPLFGFLECIAFGWIYGMSIVIVKIPAKYMFQTMFQDSLYTSYLIQMYKIYILT